MYRDSAPESIARGPQRVEGLGDGDWKSESFRSLHTATARWLYSLFLLPCQYSFYHGGSSVFRVPAKHLVE